MSEPHPYADVIKAWADGAQIQYQSPDGLWWDYVNQWSHYAPTFEPSQRWRVKPEPRKVRLGLLKDGSLHLPRTNDEARQVGQSTLFVKWLTDWIEYEVN